MKIFTVIAITALAASISQAMAADNEGGKRQRKGPSAEKRAEIREKMKGMSEEEKKAFRTEMKAKRDAKRGDMKKKIDAMSEEEKKAFFEKRRAEGKKKGECKKGDKSKTAL